jgi:uncharacterized protein YacL (UPF0231 family)
VAYTQQTFSLPGQRYGSFAGKESSAEPATPHTPGILTQLAPYAISGGRYVFVAKAASDEPTVQVGISVGGAFESWEDYVRAVHQKSQLEKEVKKKKAELKKVEKQIQAAQKKEPTEGILAKLLTLELKKDEIKVEVHAKQSDLISLQWIIDSQEIDDDDEEVMFLGS